MSDLGNMTLQGFDYTKPLAGFNLIDVCLGITFVCVFFLLLNRHIRVNTAARAWSCFTLLGVVGVYCNPSVGDFVKIMIFGSSLPYALVWIGVTGFYVYITVKAHRRGYI